MKNADTTALLLPLKRYIRAFKPYIGVLFFLLFAAVYGFVIMRIDMLSSITVDSSEVTAKANASPTPRIDTDALEQLQSLKDNSVNVQTLFQEGRDNPFKE